MTSDTALLYRHPGVKLVRDSSLFSPPNLFAFLLVVSTASLVLYLTYILHTLVGTTHHPPILTLTLNVDLEKAASGASGACGHFVGNPAILRTFRSKYPILLSED